ncbi:MAG: binding-protein-dependent transport system inner rane component [Thermoleophilia bacterium]|nr:binding-protein-dependent transport system inner rane component [Thermoleophilia bacterium]
MMSWLLTISLRAAITMLVVSFIMFLLLFIGPNPLEQLRENPDYSPADIERISHEYGWDKPWPVQYGTWLQGFVTGDWGVSMQTKRPARQMIVERIPLTLLLTMSAMVFSLMVAMPLGMYLAVRSGSRTDFAVSIASFGLMATPGFFLALLLQVGALKWYHTTGHMPLYAAGVPIGGVVERSRYLALPVLSLCVVQIAGWSRFQRSQMLGQLHSQYLQAARAKGLPARLLYVRHALPNTLVPTVTLVAIDIAVLFGGAVVTETIFGLPGMGSMLLQAVQTRDVVVALDIVVIGAFLMVVANTAANLACGIFDPRLRTR